MKPICKSVIVGGLVLVFVAGVSLGMTMSQPALGGGKEKAPAVAPRYTVVQNGLTGMVVTDNQSNTLYFYSIDAGSDPGADMKLRGTMDLNLVGKEAIPQRAFGKK